MINASNDGICVLKEIMFYIKSIHENASNDGICVLKEITFYIKSIHDTFYDIGFNIMLTLNKHTDYSTYSMVYINLLQGFMYLTHAV